MEKVYEIKEYILNFYAKYSRYVDWGLKFILALLSFAFVNNQVGFFPSLSNPVVTFGLSVVCTFLPMIMTVIVAAALVLVHFFTLAPGAAVVSGLILFFMFAVYFRFVPGKAIILLVTPLAFTMQIPMAVPIVFGLIGSPLCVVPVAFGVLIYYMISYVKSYATVIGTVAESGAISQIISFTQQLFSNKEMWITIMSFTIVLFVVYNIKRLAVDHAWDIAIVAGVLVNIIIMSFGCVMMDIAISYVSLVVGSLAAVLIALLVELFVFSVDYSRTEYLQFEDDEYYYYVKAIPKVSMTVREKTVKKINVRQNTEEASAEDTNEVKEAEPKKETEENRRKKMEEEESEIQKIIEEELKN